MAGTIFHLDAANLFVGDVDPEDSQFLTLKDVKLPSLEEGTKSHKGGGAAAEIEIGTGQINALMLGFNLEGFNPTVINKFMPAPRSRIKYTVRGNMRDLRTHENLEVRAIIEGRMTKVDLSEFKVDDGMASSYEIKEVMFYQLFFGGTEKFYFDYFAGKAGARIDGVAMFGDAARNIGL